METRIQKVSLLTVLHLYHCRVNMLCDALLILLYTHVYLFSERVTLRTAVDWREYGAVSSVHSQGSCGACWAITAVETMESANALKTGTLIDLAETEVIVCEEDCEMCNGGWPQNAYDFNMDNGGLLAESSWSYDGDFLYTLTAARDGESENYE